MAQTYYSLIKVRRGTDEQRKGKKFEQGEPLYTTDTRRFFVGNGSEANGGDATGNLTFSIRSNTDPNDLSFTGDTSRIINGDILFTNNKIWRYNGESYDDVSPVTDDVTIFYNDENKLAVKADSVNYISGNGINIDASERTISVKVTENNPIDSNENGVELKENSISTSYLDSASFSSIDFKKSDNRLTSVITLNLNDGYFDRTGDDIKVKAVEFGDTLDSGDTYGSINAGINNRFAQNDNEKVGVSLDITSGSIGIDEPLRKNQFSSGNIVGIVPGIVNIAAVSETNGNYNGSISSIYDESQDETSGKTHATWYGAAQKEVTLYNGTADSTNLTNGITAKSAGFIIIEGGAYAENGVYPDAESITDDRYNTYRRFAIPVYALPPAPIVDIEACTLAEIQGKYFTGCRLYKNKVLTETITVPVLDPETGAVIGTEEVGTKNYNYYEEVPSVVINDTTIQSLTSFAYNTTYTIYSLAGATSFVIPEPV